MTIGAAFIGLALMVALAFPVYEAFKKEETE